MTRRDRATDATPRRRQSAAEAASVHSLAAFVADALADATPRSATLALLRFDEYLDLLRRTGVDVSPTGALAGALRRELSVVCRADALAEPGSGWSAASGG